MHQGINEENERIGYEKNIGGAVGVNIVYYVAAGENLGF